MCSVVSGIKHADRHYILLMDLFYPLRIKTNAMNFMCDRSIACGDMTEESQETCSIVWHVASQRIGDINFEVGDMVWGEGDTFPMTKAKRSRPQVVPP
jgi:hypothetical protein